MNADSVCATLVCRQLEQHRRAVSSTTLLAKRRAVSPGAETIRHCRQRLAYPMGCPGRGGEPSRKLGGISGNGCRARFYRVVPRDTAAPWDTRDRQVAVALTRQRGPARRSRPSDARQRRLQGVLRRFIRRPAVVSDDHQFHMFETRIGSHAFFYATARHCAPVCDVSLATILPAGPVSSRRVSQHKLA